MNWNTIRQIEAPFIPRLRSITDTSYFPTEELEQVPELPADGDASGANKDLAFLGCVLFLDSRSSISLPFPPLPFPLYCALCDYADCSWTYCSYTFKRFTISSQAF